MGEAGFFFGDDGVLTIGFVCLTVGTLGQSQPAEFRYRPVPASTATHLFNGILLYETSLHEKHASTWDPF